VSAPWQPGVPDPCDTASIISTGPIARMLYGAVCRARRGNHKSKLVFEYD